MKPIPKRKEKVYASSSKVTFFLISLAAEAWIEVRISWISFLGFQFDIHLSWKGKHRH